MIALPNRGLLPVGLCSAHHTGEVAREGLPALGGQVREPRGRDPLRGVARDWDTRNRQASPEAEPSTISWT
jgi:hypothetical protein